jgi:ubiquitin C-terminal hydrolase
MSFVYYNIANVPTAFGLQNKGATCWFNAILQLFISLSSLNVKTKEIINGLSRCKFLKLFHKLVAEKGCGDALNMIHKQLVADYGENTPTGLNSQECAAEGYDYIMDSLKHEVAMKLFISVYTMSFTCTSCKTNLSITRDIAYRIDLFDTKSPLINLPNTDASRAIFENFVLNRISIVDEYNCTSCNQVLRDFPRVERLRQIHEVLVFTLNKFYSKDIQYYPEYFNIPYGRDEKRGQLRYKLVAKVEHSGSLNGGHYYAHCLRNFEGAEKWYNLNDTSVNDGNPAPTAETFIIAYHIESLILGGGAS